MRPLVVVVLLFLCFEGTFAATNTARPVQNELNMAMVNAVEVFKQKSKEFFNLLQTGAETATENTATAQSQSILFRDETREDLNQRSCIAIVVLLGALFTWQVVFPAAENAVFLHNMKCMLHRRWESSVLQTVLAAKSGFSLRHVEILPLDDPPTFSRGYIVELAYQNSKFLIRPVSKTTGTSQGILAVVVTYVDSGSIMDGFILPGDILIGMDCKEFPLTALSETAEHDDVSGFNNYLTDIIWSNMHLKSHVLHTIRATGCFRRSPSNNDLQYVAGEQCDNLAQFRSIKHLNSMNSYWQTNKPRTLEQEVSFIDTSSPFGDVISQAAPEDTASSNKILYGVLGTNAVVASFLFGLAFYASTGMNFKGKVVTWIRIFIVPSLLMISATVMPVVALAPGAIADVTNRRFAFVLVTTLVGVVVLGGYVLTMIGLVRGKSTLLKGSRRPFYLYSLGLTGMVFISFAIPVLGYLNGRVQADNISLRSLRAMTFVLNWLSTSMASLMFMYSILKTISKNLKIPVPLLFTQDGWEVTTSSASFALALGGFLEYTRDMHGNGGTCDVGKLHLTLASFCGETVEVRCEHNQKSELPAGMSCIVDSPNGYVTTVACYDYGLIGGVWSGVQEDAQLETLKAACAIKRGCDFHELETFVGSHGRVSCPTTGTASIGTHCMVDCTPCNQNVVSEQVGAVCRAVVDKPNAYAAWSLVHANQLGCPVCIS